MSPRSDALRSRERVLEAARGLEGDVRLNEVARRAGVGVGTVYRHFPTVHALTEALTVETLERLRDVARVAAAEPDDRAFATFVSTALDLQLDDGGLQAVLLSAEDESAYVTSLKLEIFDAFEATLDRARRSGVVRSGLTTSQIEHLICGMEHAVRLGDRDDRALFLTILLDGMRA